MELGQRIRLSRMEAGLSQRQLCGETITRNMLSQIENGTAKPSMGTLTFLATQLGKPVSYFLEEMAVTSPNLDAMTRARDAWRQGDAQRVIAELEHYREPDAVFNEECRLLKHLAVLHSAERAMREGKLLLAQKLLEEQGTIGTGYCAEMLERKRLLLLGKAARQQRREVCEKLPPLDEELLLRAQDALAQGQLQRGAALLDAAEDQLCPEWNYLRGEVYLAEGRFSEATACYHRAEETLPEQTAPRLERCYRELEDFKQAYHYACLQK